MNKLIFVPILFAACFVLQIFMPWWAMAIACFAVCYVMRPGLLAAFVGSMLAVTLLWGSAFVLALLAFAAGFLVRPLGALVFGRLGDLIGRKYTFLVTIVVMGLSTCMVGLLPTWDAIGTAAPVLLVAPEDVRTVSRAAVAGGPVILGSIQPERRADLRAEVSAVVTQVLKDNGEAVRRGDLVVRLDDASIRDSLASAEEAARASGQAHEQAERQLQRLKTLQAQGMTSMQALEDAEVRRNNAQSDLVGARARLAQARQQLQRTEVRAPFDGVVSDRKVSVGDTAQVGKELVKVIDPRSMRFEGQISADRLDDVRIDQSVTFRINGFGDEEFAGTVKRLDATANATTRQVEVVVALAVASSRLTVPANSSSPKPLMRNVTGWAIWPRDVAIRRKGGENSQSTPT